MYSSPIVYQLILILFADAVTVVAEVVVVPEPTSTTLGAVWTELGSCLRAGPASVPSLHPRTHLPILMTTRVCSGAGRGDLGSCLRAGPLLLLLVRAPPV